MTTRKLQQVIRSQPTSDGAGVKLRRSLGQAPGMRLDPFLMLDEFSSQSADDYIAGFPDHPHRGFETVTYMLDGHMLHQDHLGALHEACVGVRAGMGQEQRAHVAGAEDPLRRGAGVFEEGGDQGPVAGDVEAQLADAAFAIYVAHRWSVRGHAVARGVKRQVDVAAAGVARVWGE